MSSSSSASIDDTFIKTAFTDEEEAFLTRYIAAWRAKFYDSKVPAKKGRKRGWVIAKPYPQFIERFYPGAAVKPLDRHLQDKMYRWFLNRTTESTRSPSKHRSKASPGLRKPRNTNAFGVFSEENKSEITELGKEKLRLSSSSDNLTIYKESSKELWAALTDEAKQEYAEKAARKNEAVKGGPSDKDIERNQSQIIRNTLNTLNNLVGYHWTGHGDAAFFVLGAYRKKGGEIDTFYGSVLDDDDAGNKGFHRFLPSFKDEITGRFRAWAEKFIPRRANVLAEVSTSEMLTPDVLELGRLTNGYPALPEIDLNEIAPKDANVLLKKFISAAWKYGARDSTTSNIVPWQLLSSSDMQLLLENPLPFRQFSSLNPNAMSTAEIYSILEAIIKEQREGRQPLRFIFDHDTTVTDGTEPIRLALQHSQVEEKTLCQGMELIDRIDFSPPRPKGTFLFSEVSSDSAKQETARGGKQMGTYEQNEDDDGYMRQEIFEALQRKGRRKIEMDGQDTEDDEDQVGDCNQSEGDGEDRAVRPPATGPYRSSGRQAKPVNKQEGSKESVCTKMETRSGKASGSTKGRKTATALEPTQTRALKRTPARGTAMKRGRDGEEEIDQPAKRKRKTCTTTTRKKAAAERTLAPKKGARGAAPTISGRIKSARIRDKNYRHKIIR